MFDDYVNELIRTQTEKGYWTSACDGGPPFTAKALVALRFSDQLDQIPTETLQKIVANLCAGQNPNGSFDPWVSSDVAKPSGADDGAVRSATAVVIAGLKASRLGAFENDGVEVQVGAVAERAEKFLEADRAASGGAPPNDGSPAWRYKRIIDRGREGDYTALYLAMAGVIDVKELPPSPLVFRLVPGSEVVLEQRVNLLLPLQLLCYDIIVQYLRNGRRPPARPDVKAFASSILEARESTLPDLKLQVGNVLSGLADSAAQALRGWRDLSSAGPTFIEGERLKALLARYSNEDGSWLYGDSITTSLAMAALHAAGTPTTDPRLGRAVEWMKSLIDGRDFIPLFSADVWITAFRVRALIATGLAPWQPPLLRAVSWLTDVQRHGSWAFQAGNTALPDMDDTSMALAALAFAYNTEQAARRDGSAPHGFGPTLREKIERALLAGRAWLLQRQNADGGWASFQPGLQGKPPGPFLTGPPPMPKDSVLARWDFLLNPPPELGDPAVEDVTARVLFALGNLGMRAYDPPIARAIEFLKRNQLESGSFWGRWTVAYVPATAWVLRGLAAVRADLTEHWVQSACDFILKAEKGGQWGEDLAAVRSPPKAGEGTPTRFHTATALCAVIDLIRAGGLPRSALSEACLQELRGDGKDVYDEEETRVVHPLVPPESFYTIPGLDRDLESEARGLWRQVSRGAEPRRPAMAMVAGAMAVAPALHPEPLRFDELLNEGDAEAEEIVKELAALRGSQPKQKLFEGLARIDGGASEDHAAMRGVGPDVLKAFEKLTTTVKIAAPTPDQRHAARKLFERAGWGVATALFCSSLPQCFACAKGAVVLQDTGRFEHTPERRIIETVQFVFDVASGDSDLMRRSAHRVRIMHEMIRHKRLSGGKHDVALGKPINQQHLLLTMLSFSTMVTDGLRSIGIPVADEEEDGWLALWREVGGHLGIKKEYLEAVDTPAKARRTLQGIRTIAWDRSDSGVSLGQTLTSLLRSFMPATVLSGLPVAMIRHMAGSACADLLGLENADWTTVLVELGAEVNKLGTELFAGSPIQHLARGISFHLLEGLANRPRQGKPGPFRIPADFIDRWQREVREHRLA